MLGSDPQASAVSIKTVLLICSLSLSGQEQGFMAGLKIPAPWTSGKNVETVHPVRDNYKFKETVHIPGARCLYLRFDPRCSSQYDYDKASAFWDRIWSVVRLLWFIKCHTWNVLTFQIWWFLLLV